MQANQAPGVALNASSMSHPKPPSGFLRNTKHGLSHPSRRGAKAAPTPGF
ncbi:MAG: hypothetical protein OXL36_00030 [Bryobacterales bacterium]|nr:hypothetical protein [Bryobacterales bacterium]MDE0292606.1 hypothetical protein [Bryobacterales bacterium]